MIILTVQKSFQPFFHHRLAEILSCLTLMVTGSQPANLRGKFGTSNCFGGHNSGAPINPFKRNEILCNLENLNT